MYMKRIKLLLIPIFLLGFTGCDVIQSDFLNDSGAVDWGKATTPDPGLGGIVGTITNAEQTWPDKKVSVFVATFYGDADGEGAFVLEPTVFPQAEIKSDGTFRIMNLPPGNYVLIIGPNAEMGLAVKEGGRVMIYEVLGDNVLEIGPVRVE